VCVLVGYMAFQKLHEMIPLTLEYAGDC
jgi:hypothetical protein